MFSDDLEVCLLRQGSRLGMVKFALALFLKRPLREPLVDFFTLSSLNCGERLFSPKLMVTSEHLCR